MDWLAFASSFIERINKTLKLDEYFIADWLYLALLLTAILCLWRGQRAGVIDLWDTVRTTKKGQDGQYRTYTDGRKLFEVGAFVVMTCGFSYLVIQGKLTEFYAVIYVSAFVTARSLRDREQRLNRALDGQGVPPFNPDQTLVPGAKP